MKAVNLGHNKLDARVKMRIIPQVKGPCSARRGQAALKKNTLLWCIEYLPMGGIFTYAYYRKSDAIKVMNLSKHYGTDTERYRQFNTVSDVSKALHVMPMEWQ